MKMNDVEALSDLRTMKILDKEKKLYLMILKVCWKTPKNIADCWFDANYASSVSNDESNAADATNNDS